MGYLLGDALHDTLPPAAFTNPVVASLQAALSPVFDMALQSKVSSNFFLIARERLLLPMPAQALSQRANGPRECTPL